MIGDHLLPCHCLDLFKNARLIIIVLEFLGKLNKFTNKLVALHFVLRDSLFLYWLADKANKENLLFNGQIRIVTENGHKVFCIIDKIVVPGILIHLHLLSQNMHGVWFSQLINQLLQLSFDCSEKGSLPVIDDCLVGFHINKRHHALGKTDSLGWKINDLIRYGFEMLL